MKSSPALFRLRLPLLLSLALLQACMGPPTQRAETLIDRAGVDVVAADAARQLTYFKERGATERFCRGPGTDSATTQSEGVELGVPVRPGGVAQVGGTATRGQVDLGGRSPAVLLARELMYRACELASNINADPATEQKIYKQFLEAIITVARTQTGAGAAAVAAEPAPIPLPGGIPNPVPDASGSDGSSTSSAPPTAPTK